MAVGCRFLEKPDGRILRILQSSAIDFGADPWPSRIVTSCFRERILPRQYIGLSRSCFFQLRQLRTIRRSLSEEATRPLLHAFVVSRLGYCNALFNGLPSKSIGNLQVIQIQPQVFSGVYGSMTMSLPQ